MELVGKEGEKMERRKGICFFLLGDTRVSIVESIDRSSCTMDPENCVTSFHFLLERRLSSDRMLHFVPDSRLTLQLFRNPIIVTRCLELSETVSTFVTRAFALRIPQRE